MNKYIKLKMETIDLIYIALLHYRGEKRYSFLRNNDESFKYHDDTYLTDLLLSFPFPRIYNQSIAKYAVFINDNTKPLVLFNNREKALNVARKKVESGIDNVYVVDIPLTEIDNIKDFIYDINDNFFYTEIIESC